VKYSEDLVFAWNCAIHCNEWSLEDYKLHCPVYTPDYSFPTDFLCQSPYLPMNFPYLAICSIRVILGDEFINLVKIHLGIR